MAATLKKMLFKKIEQYVLFVLLRTYTEAPFPVKYREGGFCCHECREQIRILYRREYRPARRRRGGG